MGSETDEMAIEDSDESLLDIKELNDDEYELPPVAAPSLESVLWDMGSDADGSDNASLHSLQSLMAARPARSRLYHGALHAVSTQVGSAADRAGAGLPTALTNGRRYVAVGTSHGYVLAFDSDQKLCWCCHDPDAGDQGAVSALAFNFDSTRLLIGYERGYISMVDAQSGDIIRRMPDAHAPQSAVLQLRFTTLNSLALCGDSSGCVFSLSFGRRLGVRVSDSKCLFSGARGEVCCFEPLVQGQEMLGNHVVVAMATLSKVIVITIKPRLKVLYTQQLQRAPTSLPLLSWQLVPVGKSIQPVLAWGRGSELNYTRVVFPAANANRVRLSQLRQVHLPYELAALHWLGPRHLALLDAGETLRLVEVRTQRELETLDLTGAGLVYGSAHFKALAIGGGVSEAFALAGERACYNSLSSLGDQLLVLGTKNVYLVKLRTWHERLVYLSDQGRWAEALNLAAEEGLHREKSTSVLLEDYLTNLGERHVDRESLTAAVNCCVKLQKIDLLCNELWDAISTDHYNQDWFFSLLANHIQNGQITSLSPAVTQALINHYEPRDPDLLEQVVLALDPACLDLDQVLRTCREKRLYNGWIHVTTRTIRDYTTPLTEFLSDLKPDDHKLGNVMLVYVSSCLAGLGYPRGRIPAEDVARVKSDVLRCLEAVHSMEAPADEAPYPYLRALLRYSARECLNVVGIAFNEPEFAGEMGMLQRQRLVQILLWIVTPDDFQTVQIVNLASFIIRLVTTNNLRLDEAVLESVVKSLTDAKSRDLGLRDQSEREQAWLDLLDSKKLPVDSTKDLLQRALSSQCYRVAERIYEQQRNFSNILECYLRDETRKNDSFDYISVYIGDEERQIQKQFIKNFKELVNANSKKTAQMVIEYFPNLIQTFYDKLEKDEELLYKFLGEIVFTDIKISPVIAERYLELLCVRNPNYVVSYVRLGLCRVDEALHITKKHDSHGATAILLEQMGEWSESLRLLLDKRMGNEAVELCVRGAEHLDSASAQRLWMEILRSSNGEGTMSPRQLLHAAAPHVPPARLLEMVSDASLGDVKTLIEGILADYTHDIRMLTTTLKLLGNDLHQGLAKLLFVSGKAVSVPSPHCGLCQKSLLYKIDEDDTVLAWGCGHAFHPKCSDGSTACPFCRTPATRLFSKRREPYSEAHNPGRSSARPDLEGHF